MNKTFQMILEGTIYRNENEVARKVIQIISNHLGVPISKIKPETRMTELGADGLDEIEIIMDFEKTFDIEISDNEGERLFGDSLRRTGEKGKNPRVKTIINFIWFKIQNRV